MRQFFKKILMILGSMTLIGICYLIAVGVFFWMHKDNVSPKTILEIDFDQELAEFVPDKPIANMIQGRSITVRDVLDVIEAGANDDRIIGIIASIGKMKMGFAQVQEIRDAIKMFRSKGKTAVAYSDTYGEFGSGNGAYYLATAFDTIYLQPSGDIGLTGFMFETHFVKGTLDKLGIIPRMDHRKEYKNAMNTFTEKQFTPHHRESLEKIMHSLFGQMVRSISEARNIPDSEVCSLIDKGPFYGQEAVDAKLADKLVYRDAIYDELKDTMGKEVSFLTLEKYLDKIDRPHSEGEKIALIYGVGGIHRGGNEYNPIFGDILMGSDDTTEAIRSAREDKDVKAILFRINSPGGSYVASDSIWREIVRARKSGKPVIVSMSNVAGSGGYFIAMAANKIVAQPGTITGSIGVVAGKMVTTGFMDKLGITSDEIHTSSNATMWSDTQDYTPEQWDKLQKALDRIYDDFTGKVAQGRKLPIEKVLEIAKGRIWTGEDARSIGLVDELGGFSTAIALAKKAAGIGEDAKINLEAFPKGKSLLERILKRITGGTEDNAQIRSFAQSLKEIQTSLHYVRHAWIGEDYGVLSMPELSVTGDHWQP